MFATKDFRGYDNVHLLEELICACHEVRARRVSRSVDAAWENRKEQLCLAVLKRMNGETQQPPKDGTPHFIRMSDVPPTG